MAEDQQSTPNQEILQEYGLPVGLIVGGVLLFIIGASSESVELLMLVGAGLLVAGGVKFVNTLRGPAEPVVLSTVPVSDEVRHQHLQERLSQDVARGAGRVESVTMYSAVVVYGKPVNHVLHLLASVFLCGLWIPVWILMAISGGERRTVLTVDPFGNILRK